MKRFSMVMLALLTVGCTKSVDDSGWDDSDADTDSDSDTDTDTDTDVSYFEAVAVGFEYVGGYDRENGELVNFDYNDGNGERLAFVRVTFADTNFFSAQSSEEQEAHQCEVLALFDWVSNVMAERNVVDFLVRQLPLGVTGHSLESAEDTTIEAEAIISGINCFL